MGGPVTGYETSCSDEQGRTRRAGDLGVPDRVGGIIDGTGESYCKEERRRRQRRGPEAQGDGATTRTETTQGSSSEASDREIRCW